MNTPARSEPKLTVDDFLAAYAGREEKFELVDGVPRMMARANRRHVQIMGNLLGGSRSASRAAHAMP